MFDLRVYSYLDTKIKAQKKVDSARLQIKRNQARYNAVIATYEANKTNKKFAKKTKSITPKIEELKLPANSPQPQTDKLQDLQKRLDAITIVSLNSSPQAATAGKAELAAIIAEVKPLVTTSKVQAKSIDSLFTSMKKVFNKNWKKGSPAPTVAQTVAEPDDESTEPETPESPDPDCTEDCQ